MSTLAKSISSTPAHVPPKNFDPSKASDLDLEKYSYPPRPDPVEAPLASASWERFSTQKVEYVPLDPTDRPETGFGENATWAGAVLYASKEENPPSDSEVFYRAIGSWKVPELSAIEDGDGEGKKLLDGRYRAASWVGLDGWDNKFTLKAGVVSDFTVKDGEADSPSHSARIEFREENKDPNGHNAPNFFVHTGDEIIVHVWSRPKSTISTAAIWNQTRGLYTGPIELPLGYRQGLEGHTAQWVFAGRKPVGEDRFPRFKEFKYKDLAAHRNDVANTEVNIKDAGIFLADGLPIGVKTSGTSVLVFTDTTQSPGEK